MLVMVVVAAVRGRLESLLVSEINLIVVDIR